MYFSTKGFEKHRKKERTWVELVSIIEFVGKNNIE